MFCSQEIQLTTVTETKWTTDPKWTPLFREYFNQLLTADLHF